MSDINSRHSVYLQRMNDGLDTHRDDIGNIVERENKRRAKLSSFSVNLKQLKKMDIGMTLLEDGRISYDDFMDINDKCNEEDMRCCAVKKDFATLNSLKHTNSKEATRIRLAKKLQRKRGVKCGCLVGSCACPD